MKSRKSSSSTHVPTSIQVQNADVLFSADTRILNEPNTKTKSFLFAGPTHWSSLPSEIRHIQSTSSFKKNPKTNLFETFKSTRLSISSRFSSPVEVCLMPHPRPPAWVSFLVCSCTFSFVSFSLSSCPPASPLLFVIQIVQLGVLTIAG